MCVCICACLRVCECVRVCVCVALAGRSNVRSWVMRSTAGGAFFHKRLKWQITHIHTYCTHTHIHTDYQCYPMNHRLSTLTLRLQQEQQKKNIKASSSGASCFLLAPPPEQSGHRRLFLWFVFLYVWERERERGTERSRRGGKHERWDW